MHTHKHTGIKEVLTQRNAGGEESGRLNISLCLLEILAQTVHSSVFGALHVFYHNPHSIFKNPVLHETRIDSSSRLWPCGAITILHLLKFD